jgi:hypothetical protein
MLLKAVDVYFVLKPVCAISDNSQHDPLVIFISLPLSGNEPWRLRHSQWWTWRAPCKKAKHTSIKWHHFRDEIQKGNIKITKIHTSLNISDILTKPLVTSKFISLRKFLMGW